MIVILVRIIVVISLIFSSMITILVDGKHISGDLMIMIIMVLSLSCGLRSLSAAKVHVTIGRTHRIHCTPATTGLQNTWRAPLYTKDTESTIMVLIIDILSTII